MTFMDDVIRLTVWTYFLVELTTWSLLWNKVNECISTELFIKTCTLNGCECVWVVGMLCVSIVLLQLLSFSLICCVHHRNLVGGIFLWVIGLCKGLCRNYLNNVSLIAGLSLRTMYPSKLSCKRTFSKKKTWFGE